jgi:hypothetical protein
MATGPRHATRSIKTTRFAQADPHPTSSTIRICRASCVRATGRRNIQRTRRPAQRPCATGRLAERESVAPNKTEVERGKRLSVPELEALRERSATGTLFHLGDMGGALVRQQGMLHTPSIDQILRSRLGPLPPCARTITCAPPPVAKRVSRLSVGLRGEVRGSMRAVQRAGISFLQLSSANAWAQ